MLGFHASTIRLDDTTAILITTGLAVALVALVPFRWDAWRRRRTGRTVTVLLAVVAVLVACGIAVNQLGGFYPTLGSLLGSSGNPGDGTVADIGEDGAGLNAALPVLAAHAAEGHGATLHLVLHGARSGLTRDADVYLPPGYTDPQQADVRYPVVEWLPGFPGEPREVAALFRVPDLVDAAIAAHRMPPTILIIPDTNGEPRFSHDQECVDANAGVADDTYLTTDLRAWATRALRVRPERAAWALAGWSSGGYCAMNLALRHPDLYGVALSQSGFDRTPDDVVTGDLFDHRADLVAANDVDALLRTHPAPVDILATAGADEPDEKAALGRIRTAVAPPVRLDTMVFPGGGHNQNAVRGQLPALVDWLGRHLPAPHTGTGPGPGVLVQPAPGVPPRVLPTPDPAPG
ncbi:alpha/beta hydrolase [Pseudonocardia hispaniensis]|uniref:Alpha/beta hydrolase n=1 Tax=Pseudonocardia hispaniensis TaxID=904933 RepID=A0ABW1J2W3_9PSEU